MSEAAQAETYDDEDVVTQEAEAAAAEPEAGSNEQGAAESEKTPDAGAPGHRSAEKRIAQLTARYRQEQREKEELRSRLEALEARIGPEPEPSRPMPDDYETTEEYEDALLSWHDDRREHARKQEKSQSNPKEAPKPPEGWETFEQQVAALARINPDAESVIFTDDYPCTDEMMQVIVESERGAELAYHLATNPADAGRIASLSPLKQARELTKIEARLPTTKPATSRAPAPANPVTPGGSTDADPEKMTADEWRRYRNEQLARRNS